MEKLEVLAEPTKLLLKTKKLLIKPKEHSGRPNIISIASNKGGVGKTSIAVLSALHYSTSPDECTLLAELDSSPGDFSTLFDIDPGKNLEPAIRFPESFQKYIKKLSSNLDIIAGTKNPFFSDTTDIKAFQKLFSILSVKYQNIVIDTQTVLSSLMLEAFLCSRKIFLVSDYSIESIARIIFFADLLINHYFIPKANIKMIINKRKFFDFLKIWDFSKLTDLPITGFISWDKRFDKTRFLTNRKKAMQTAFFKQLRKIIKNES